MWDRQSSACFEEQSSPGALNPSSFHPCVRWDCCLYCVHECSRKWNYRLYKKLFREETNMLVLKVAQHSPDTRLHSNLVNVRLQNFFFLTLYCARLLEALYKLRCIRSTGKWLTRRLLILLHKLETQINRRPQFFSILLRNSICICSCVNTVCITSEDEVLLQAVKIISTKRKHSVKNVSRNKTP